MTRKRSPEVAMRETIAYDPATGIFTWLVTTRNGKGGAGNIAGCLGDEGYYSISVNRKRYKSHRLAWLFVYGELPRGDLDHINGDRSDNRIANLRPATRSQNAANSRRRRNNSSGFKGVSFHAKTRKWRAQISIGALNSRCVKSLGLFVSPEEAHAAYCVALRAHAGSYARFT